MLTYWAEVALLFVVLLFSAESLAHDLVPVILLGLATGFYNCLFWMTQRTLFLELITNQDTGRQYGNFQIFVGIFLKGGIFVGGVLLEHFGFEWIFVLTVAAVILISIILKRLEFHSYTPATASPVSFDQLRRFRDEHRSKTIFYIDGLFLFLESHFWTVSLFMLTNQDFARLGIIVIGLALVFAVAFFIAKNTSDSYTGSKVYRVATVLYSISWLLRAAADGDQSLQTLFLLLLLITFFSSFFRLSFNKRFYDVAMANQPRSYLIIKSYYTQCCVAIIFFGIATAAAIINNDAITLPLIYGISALISLIYLFYLPASRAE